jgi:hypothetical protein
MDLLPFSGLPYRLPDAFAIAVARVQTSSAQSVQQKGHGERRRTNLLESEIPLSRVIGASISIKSTKCSNAAVCNGMVAIFCYNINLKKFLQTRPPLSQ